MPTTERRSWARRPTLCGSAAAAAAALALPVACSEVTPPPPPPPPRPEAVVSEPLASLAGSASPSLGAIRISAAISDGGAERLVYVSLPSGAFPSGTMAIIRNTSRGPRLTQPMVDGGFDPIPIAAGVGDTVEIAIHGITSVLATIRRPVPRARRPGVVRTNPPKGKRDVALNSRITIIFSEPVDPATITSSVSLSVPGGEISGTVRVLADGMVAEFIPSTPLGRTATHRLLISDAVRDVDGNALDGPVSMEFSTGTATLSAVTSVVVEPAGATLEMGDVHGDSVQLAATLMTPQGPATDREVIWFTSDATVAVVASNGRVMARGAGIATITATSEGQADSARITVVPIPVAAVTVNVPGPPVQVGGTGFVTAGVADRNGQPLRNRPVTWESADPQVATVDQRGLITGIDTGTVTITAASEGVSGTGTVRVGSPIETDRVEITPLTTAVTVGDTGRLAARLYRCDSGGTCTESAGASVVWSSDNSSVLSVDTAGRLTARVAGAASITARVEDLESRAAVTVIADAPLTFASVSAGYYFTCGLTTLGRAYCWGQNAYAELGIGVNAPLPERQPAAVAPVPVSGDLTFTSISVGGWHVCGLTASLETYCWGLSNFGQVGDVGSAEIQTCELGLVNTIPIGCATLPTRVEGVPPLRAVYAGGLVTCGLALDGTAYCWGGNRYGQLGDGSGVTDYGRAPTPVAGGLTFDRLSAGWRHACGITSEARAYCWGYNFTGQLGDGTNVNRGAPTLVAGDHRFVNLVAFANHTCALTPDAMAYCWGDNYYAQLGDGSRVSSNVPVAVAGGAFAGLVAAEAQTCGLAATGRAYCWGATWSEESSNGWTIATSPAPIESGLLFSAITAGANHLCGLTPNQVAYCWGSNRAGQLGDGTTTKRAAPVRVVGQ